MTPHSELLEILPEGLPANTSSSEAACLIAERIAGLPRGEAPRIAGINGAQGSGKSTLSRLVVEALSRFHGSRTVLLSLDDFYLGKPWRYRLESEVHPLCVTRGVPGTHDVQLMDETIAALERADPEDRTPLPRFDKLSDDRKPREEWPEFEGPPDVILLEGWCVGLLERDVPTWSGPVNELEEQEDPDGEWFRWSFEALRSEYPIIWDRIDMLVSIEVRDLEAVIASRLLQEEDLKEDGEHKRMDREAVTRFVQHYERYTRALWDAMPARADMLFRRDNQFGYSLVERES